MLIGIIGKANVGKSTFFNAATELAVQAANYPFTTINSNIGIVHARQKCICTEFGVQDNPIHSICIDGNRFIPLNLIDIAGLVPGAHLGKGLGNKFLDDARQADALIHIVDASGSTDSEGKPISPGTRDPISDISFVEEEFDLWLASVVSRDWNKVSREAESQGQKLEQMLAKRLSGLAIGSRQIADALDETGLYYKKTILWTREDIFNFCKVIRLKSKPIVLAANKADLSTVDKNINSMKKTGRDVIVCASEAENLLRRAAKKGIIHYLPGDNSFSIKQGAELNDQQKKALSIISNILSKYGSTGIQEVINYACFKILNLIVVYPVEDEHKLIDKKGNVLPDARLLPRGSTAKDLAQAIHADLAKGFLYAIDIRSKQRLSSEYKLKNNDVIKIVSATSRN
ncbi:MAG TPA: redox-regulated ATPase YchF [Nitrososphaeraceae archaeon]|jgi:ribosome-binding ATPase YchF (GTP1/OBG family)|nr:redox-regulated ATPase YchF [Nitrososphaeraceae archaeon]